MFTRGFTAALSRWPRSGHTRTSVRGGTRRQGVVRPDRGRLLGREQEEALTRQHTEGPWQHGLGERKKPVTRGHVFCGPPCVRWPEEANPQRQEAGWRCPGRGGAGCGGDGDVLEPVEPPVPFGLACSGLRGPAPPGALSRLPLAPIHGWPFPFVSCHLVTTPPSRAFLLPSRLLGAALCFCLSRVEAEALVSGGWAEGPRAGHRGQRDPAHACPWGRPCPPDASCPGQGFEAAASCGQHIQMFTRKDFSGLSFVPALTLPNAPAPRTPTPSPALATPGLPLRLLCPRPAPPNGHLPPPLPAASCDCTVLPSRTSREGSPWTSCQTLGALGDPSSNSLCASLTAASLAAKDILYLSEQRG